MHLNLQHALEITYTNTYKQGDELRGRVHSSEVRAQPLSTTTRQPLPPPPSVLSSVHSVISADGRTRKGDIITYTAEVSNTGNTCLTNVEVTESFLDGGLDCGTGALRHGFPHARWCAVSAVFGPLVGCACNAVPLRGESQLLPGVTCDFAERLPADICSWHCSQTL